MKHAIIIILMAFLLVVCTNDAFAGPVPLPACNLNGEPVRYRAYQMYQLNAYDLQTWVAASGTMRGYPIISYNSTMLAASPKEWAMQVMIHECGHLKLHANVPLPETPLLKEQEADCYSVDVLKSQYYYTDEQFDIIAAAMAKLVSPQRLQAFKTCLNR